MKVLDLFAGIGGFSLAAHWMGWETIAFVERDQFCQKVLRKNFGQDIEIHDDITTFSGKPFRGRIDLITGGFPCQPYSVAGERRGTEDDRHLWPEMLRTIEEVRPRYVVGENVFGLLTWSGGLVFEQIQTDLEATGYEVWAGVVPACGVEAFHERERIWIVANAAGSGLERPRLQRPDQNETSVRKATQPESRTDRWGLDWSAAATRLCRVGNGVPRGMDRDRVKALGNSIVPQVAYEIFKAIEASEQ